MEEENRMCVPGPPLFLLPTLRELKGSRNLLQGGDTWPYIPDVHIVQMWVSGH